MLCVNYSYAQTKSTQKREFKFGKISPNEFEIKGSGPDSAAAAIKIFDVGECYFELSPLTGEFIYVFERHVRYKILNKNGYGYGNYTLGLHKSSGSSKESLDFMDGATYNMVDGKMVTSKLNKDAKFSEEFNKYYSYKKFALPNIKENSIIEFKYKIKSDFIFTLRGWSFQSDIPTLWSEYNVRIPEYLRYKTNISGYYRINHPVAGESINASYVTGLNSSATYDKYTVENVPALKDEPFVSSLDDYRPQVDFELQSTKYPNQFYRDYTGNWPKIVEGLLTDENFGGYINRNGYAKNTLPTILKGEKDTLAAVKLIFNYVKNELKWDKNYSKYSNETNPKVIFDKKTGNSADINLSLIGLLKEAKFDVYPVLVSTRENGMHPGYPVITKFNNVVGLIKIADKFYFLDAINKSMPMGMLSYENLNHQGFCIDMKSKGGNWIPTEPEFAYEKIFIYNLSLDKENKLKGTINQYAKGYAAYNLREKYLSKNNQTEYLKDFKKNKDGLEISNYSITNLNDIDEILTESMDVVIDDNVDEAGNLVYLTPLLFERSKENIFKREERNFPVDFAYPIKETYTIRLNFPDGYEIDKLPSSNIYKIPEDKGSFAISYFTEGKTLMVKSVISINRSLYIPEDYFHLKELYKMIVEKQAQQIVFKKKA